MFSPNKIQGIWQEGMLWVEPVATSKLLDCPHPYIKGNSQLKASWADMSYKYAGENTAIIRWWLAETDIFLIVLKVCTVPIWRSWTYLELKSLRHPLNSWAWVVLSSKYGTFPLQCTAINFICGWCYSCIMIVAKGQWITPYRGEMVRLD